MKKYISYIIAVVIAELVGVLGSLWTAPAIGTGWYASLVKPDLSPPNWVFAPVWTTLFALMGIAAGIVWNSDAEEKLLRRALSVFSIQLVLNALWSYLFFGLESPGGAFAEIVVLWLAIAVTIVFFSRVSRFAAWLLVPYIIWVSFAGYLNYEIWRLNQYLDSAGIEPVVCTMEAKLCPDGSYVGRTGPKCEFAPCPSRVDAI